MIAKLHDIKDARACIRLSRFIPVAGESFGDCGKPCFIGRVDLSADIVIAPRPFADGKIKPLVKVGIINETFEKVAYCMRDRHRRLFAFRDDAAGIALFPFIQQGRM